MLASEHLSCIFVCKLNFLDLRRMRWICRFKHWPLEMPAGDLTLRCPAVLGVRSMNSASCTWHTWTNSGRNEMVRVISHWLVLTSSSSPHHLIIPSPKLIPVTQESAQQRTLEAFSYPDLFVSLYLCTWHQQHSVVTGLFSHEAIESPTALCAKKPDRTCGTASASLIHRRLPTRPVNVMPLY